MKKSARREISRSMRLLRRYQRSPRIRKTSETEDKAAASRMQLNPPEAVAGTAIVRRCGCMDICVGCVQHGRGLLPEIECRIRYFVHYHAGQTVVNVQCCAIPVLYRISICRRRSTEFSIAKRAACYFRTLDTFGGAALEWQCIRFIHNLRAMLSKADRSGFRTTPAAPRGVRRGCLSFPYL